MSEDTGGDEHTAPFDIEGFLASQAPPSVPQEALARARGLSAAVARLDPVRSAPLIAILSTDPRLQANAIRIDWLLRLVLGLGDGRRKAHRADIQDLLNRQLVEAFVDRLEDPPEGPFIESIPTSRGNFRIFPSYFEKAATHTECLISAFEALPHSPHKAAALDRAYDLLRLSEDLVMRCAASPSSAEPSLPWRPIPVPSDERLRMLSKRLHFRRADLERLGIDPGALKRFFLPQDYRRAIATSEAGASPMDFYPLLPAEDGLQVLAPYALSMAVRACLIDCASTGGQAGPLQVQMLIKQGRDIEDTALLQVSRAPVVRLAGQPARDVTIELSSGRYLHVIQTADDFDGWADRCFGVVSPCPPSLQEAVGQSIDAARDFAQRHPGFLDGMTLWLPGGWGSARAVTDPSLFDRGDWPLLVVEPADAAVIGSCEDGKLEDIWRLKKIEDRMAAAGFEMHGANGLLNLFQWWRDTEMALVPPHVDAVPPISINYPTDLLAKTRKEADLATGRRVRLHPSQGWLLTSRLDRQEFSGPLKPIYISLPHMRRRQILGCAEHRSSTWWIEGVGHETTTFNDIWETWKAGLEWANAVMPAFVAAFGDTGPLSFRIKVGPRFDVAPPALLTDQQINSSLTVGAGPEGIEIDLSSDWHWGLHRPDNAAEIELAAALQAGARLAAGEAAEFEAMRALARTAAGSDDFRFRHSLEAYRVIDELRGRGLVGRAATMSRSAGALVKCGSAWEVRDRADGGRIEGLDACVAFLAAFRTAMQEKLLEAIRPFDRGALVTACLNTMQAAEGDLRNWDNTARALRSIHGIAGDHKISLEAASNANGLLRAGAIIAEIAASEARPGGGRAVGPMDLEELQALALMVFLAGDMVPALYSGRMKPVLRLSPGGDVQYDHQFHDETVRDSAEQRQARVRATASADYLERFARLREPREVSAAFSAAVEAEYGVPHAVLREFATAAVSLAADLEAGVFTLRRSELLDRLRRVPGLGRMDFAPMVDRLSLPNRARWVDFPTGSHRGDADLSRFDRRYSLIARPIVALDACADPQLVVAPAIVERALVHNAQGAMTGTLQNDFWASSVMRAFSSQAGAEAGFAFNDEIAALIASFGLRTWPSAKPSWCLNTKKTPEVDQLGDIDVLAVSADSSTVWVVEAKDLKLCRTLGETCRRLADYRGVEDQKGRPDALLKHLRRVDFLRANAARLVGRLGLSAPPEVRGLIVVRAPQPMSQLRREFREDAKVVTLDELSAQDWNPKATT